MRRVFIIVPSVSGGGGAERTACLLANGLSKFHEVEVLAMSEKEPLYELNSNVLYVKIDSFIGRAGNSVSRNALRVRFLVKRCKERKPDLVIGYTIQGGIIARLVANFVTIKTIVCERQDPRQFGKIQRMIRDRLYKKTDGAVFQTNEAQEYFSSIVKNSVVIPNFVDDLKLPVAKNFFERKNVICSAGRLESAKNHEMLICAFCNIMDDFPSYILEIWGEGSLRDVLERLIVEKNAEQRIFLRGRTDKIFEKINDSKIFVLSSNYEGYPNALLEAMALGNACISTDCPCGGPKDMIQDGVNGYMIPVRDTRKLEKSLISLLENEDNMKLIGERALQKRQTNGKDIILKRWFEYIESILAS